MVKVLVMGVAPLLYYGPLDWLWVNLDPFLSTWGSYWRFLFIFLSGICPMIVNIMRSPLNTNIHQLLDVHTQIPILNNNIRLSTIWPIKNLSGAMTEHNSKLPPTISLINMRGSRVKLWNLDVAFVVNRCSVILCSNKNCPQLGCLRHTHTKNQTWYIWLILRVIESVDVWYDSTFTCGYVQWSNFVLRLFSVVLQSLLGFGCTCPAWDDKRRIRNERTLVWCLSKTL